MSGSDLLQPAARNHYFTGKFLSAGDFELEQQYEIKKHRLQNHFISGWGVVSGLNVEPSKEGSSITVSPGYALDPWGRDMVMDQPEEVKLPSGILDILKNHPRRLKPIILGVMLGYEEIEDALTPAMTDSAESSSEFSLIRERGKIELIQEACPDVIAKFPEDLKTKGKISYSALAKWISAPPDFNLNDPRIPLANVRLTPKKSGGKIIGVNLTIDITVRPIVYTPRMLYALIQAGTAKKSVRRKRPDR